MNKIKITKAVLPYEHFYTQNIETELDLYSYYWSTFLNDYKTWTIFSARETQNYILITLEKVLGKVVQHMMVKIEEIK
ncbi:MAG: hypothetical protein KDC52_04300 [Ignavibacteriae bacterium]|nr:hypothetical protein [Romboutsia sp.]MCB0750673.1 hypothetical protein [Ignavibacteriota bacterium]